MLVDQEFFVEPIPVLDEESSAFFAIIKDFKGAVNGGDLITQEVPTKMSLTGRLPTCAGSSIKSDFHVDLLSLLAGVRLVVKINLRYLELSCKSKKV
jgi:hypothetical protein